jgi:hypothetical protein
MQQAQRDSKAVHEFVQLFFVAPGQADGQFFE